MQNGREGKALHAVYIRHEDGSPEGLQDFPSEFTAPGIVDMQNNGFREAMQNGREGKVLHAVYIRLKDGSPEGLQDFPSHFNVPGIVDVHHNDFREVLYNGREGKASCTCKGLRRNETM